MSWWLDENPTDEKNKEKLKRVLDCIEVNGATVDWYSFQMELALWKDVYDNFSFPIPRL